MRSHQGTPCNAVAQQFTQEVGLNFKFGPSTFDLLICISLAHFADKLAEPCDRIPSKAWITNISKSILFAVSFILLFLFCLRLWLLSMVEEGTWDDRQQG